MCLKKLICVLPELLLCGCCFALPLFFYGCTQTATINGVRYEVLSPDEEELLVKMAQGAIDRSNRSFTAAEQTQCRNSVPKLTIEYKDDRAGIAKVVWTIEKKRVIVVLNGPFLTQDMQWMLYTEPLSTEIVDQTHRPKKPASPRKNPGEMVR